MDKPIDVYVKDGYGEPPEDWAQAQEALRDRVNLWTELKNNPDRNKYEDAILNVFTRNEFMDEDGEPLNADIVDAEIAAIRECEANGDPVPEEYS